MKNLLLLSFLVLMVASCKKKTNVVIQAQDYITGDGSAYAGMEYAVVEAWTPVLETKSKIVATGFLDDNGHAAFDLKMKNNRKYILGVAQPDNICYGGVVQYYLDHEKNNNVTFEYLKCGAANIHLENINCEGGTDVIKHVYYYTQNLDIYIYKGGGATGSTTNWTWADYHPASGCYSYYGNYSVEVPEGEYTVEWQASRPSGITTGISTFTVNANDTTTFLIQY